MRCSLLAIVFGTLAVGGMTLAHHDEHGKGGVKKLSQKDITEKINGKKTKATSDSDELLRSSVKLNGRASDVVR